MQFNSSNPQALFEENLRLRRAVEELSILNDLARGISASLDSNEIMEIIVRRSLRAVQAEQGVITLIDAEENSAMKTLIRAVTASAEQEQFHVSQNLLGWMQLNKKPLLVNSPRTDERFRGVEWGEATSVLRSALAMCRARDYRRRF